MKFLKVRNLIRGSLSYKPIFFVSNVDNSKDWYKILQVAKNATPEDIKKSYYTLAKKYHPDVNKGSDENFKEINRAYEILSNEDSRRQFDQNAAGDSYSSSTQNTYSNYHYGYNTKGKSYSKPSGYSSSEFYEYQKRSKRQDGDYVYRSSYSFKKKRNYDAESANDFYKNFRENTNGDYGYDQYNSRNEYVL